MRMWWKQACLAILLGAFAGSVAAYGDEAAPGTAGHRTVAASGESSLQRKPTQLRMCVQLIGKGKTLKDALAKLKERQEAAALQLETLKADKKSITFAAPTISNDQSSRRRQIQTMIVARMKAQGKKVPKGLQTPQSVAVSSTMTARWPLDSDSNEKTLLLVYDLQEKIKAADLTGAKEAEKLSAEEEEFEEEVNQMQQQYGEDAQQANQAQFVFVAKLSKAERQKVAAEAFVKAKQQAADLAQAAGVELGPLVSLSGTSGRFSVDPRYMQYGISSNSQALRQLLLDESGDDSSEKSDDKDEVVGLDPSNMKFSYSVSATFQLGK